MNLLRLILTDVFVYKFSLGQSRRAFLAESQTSGWMHVFIIEHRTPAAKTYRGLRSLSVSRCFGNLGQLYSILQPVTTPILIIYVAHGWKRGFKVVANSNSDRYCHCLPLSDDEVRCHGCYLEFGSFPPSSSLSLPCTNQGASPTSCSRPRSKARLYSSR